MDDESCNNELDVTKWDGCIGPIGDEMNQNADSKDRLMHNEISRPSDFIEKHTGMRATNCKGAKVK